MPGDGGIKRLARRVDGAVRSLGSQLTDHAQPALQEATLLLSQLQGLVLSAPHLDYLGPKVSPDLGRAQPTVSISGIGFRFVHLQTIVVIQSDMLNGTSLLPHSASWYTIANWPMMVASCRPCLLTQA